MTAPLDVDVSASTATPEAALAAPPSGGGPIQGRSLSQIAWMRLKRDKVAIAGFFVVVLLVLIALLAPVITSLTGHGPQDTFPDKLNGDLGGIPYGHLSGADGSFLLGVDPGTGHDVFSRIVYGARISLLIATVATLLSVTIGTVLGIVAGYFGGWVDGAVGRLMDILLAFPSLLFSIALIAVVPDNFPRVAVIIFVVGFFGWPYIGRIIRGQTLSLREREYVDAARSLGASDAHIIFKQLLPNLFAPILVYATLIIPTNITLEAALSFLGVGVKPPTPSWGEMLQDATNWYTVDPFYLAVPGVALFITVLAFNLFGDGLRDALDPKAGR